MTRPNYTLAISPYSPMSGTGALFNMVDGAATADNAPTWPAANRAIGYPFVISSNVPPLDHLWVEIGDTAASNFDLGVYDEDFVRIVSTGSQPATGIRTTNRIDVSTDLARGVYYMVMSCDTLAAHYVAFTAQGTEPATMRSVGCFQQAAAFPLPATITPVVSSIASMFMFGLAFAD